MFSVKMEWVIESCMQLAREEYEYNQLNYELEISIQTLKGLSSLDAQIQKLLGTLSVMQGQQTILKQMTQVLDKTAISYVQCENRICDYGEQNVVRYKRREVESTSFNEIVNMLSSVNFAR